MTHTTLLEMFKVLNYLVFPLKFYFSRSFMFKMNFVCQKYKMLCGGLKLTSKKDSMSAMFGFTFSSNVWL